jgi:hypothetical protein
MGFRVVLIFCFFLRLCADSFGQGELHESDNISQLSTKALSKYLSASSQKANDIQWKHNDTHALIFNSWVNNHATDYDWNRGGGKIRDAAIRLERERAGLNDTHGFKTFYYGTGVLRK